MIEQVYLLLLAAVVGFCGKLLWDKLNSSGMDTKGIYMTKEEFKNHKTDCGIDDFKSRYDVHREEVIRHAAKIDQQLDNIEKTLKTNADDVKELSGDVKSVRKQLNTLQTIIEMSMNKMVANG